MNSKKEKVILIEDMKGLGKKNEVKEVNSSFAYNFLFPNKKASTYKKENQEKLKKEKEKEIKQKILKEQEDRILFKRINETKIYFSLKKEKNKIFGSVGLSDILKKLKKEGLEINKKKIINFTPIREEGIFLILLRINNKLSTNLEIEVRANS